MRKILWIGGLAAVLGGGAYIGANIKIINVATVADTDRAILWCGGNAGLLGYQPELARGNGRNWMPFNGQTLRDSKQEFMDEVVLEMADNPFGSLGVGLVSNYFDGLASGFDSAIRQECSGEKGAYLNFVENIGSTFDPEQAMGTQEPDYSQPEIDSQGTAFDSPQYEDEPQEEDYFSCVDLSEPTFLEDKIIFTATNNCSTTIDLIGWDINILTTDFSLIDTSEASFSDLRVGEAKQDEIYLDTPVGEFNWEAIPASAYAF